MEKLPCPVQDCSYETLSFKLLLGHLCNHHLLKDIPQVVQCRIQKCQFKTSSFHSYRMHLNRQHAKCKTVSPELNNVPNCEDSTTDISEHLRDLQTCLVLCDGCKKIINVTGGTLFQEIEKRFKILLQGQTVQRYSPEFEEWYDLSEQDHIPSLSKIRVVKKVQIEGDVDKLTSSALDISSGTAVKLPTLSLSKPIKSPSPREANSSDLHGDQVDNNEANSSVSSDSIQLVRESSRSSENTSSDKSVHNPASSSLWPLVYSLPSFSADVQRYLENYELGAALLPKIRKAIVEALYVDLSKYGMYPGASCYHQVCYTLVSQYPQLRDRHVLPGCCNYTMWLNPLKSKFKASRLRMEKTGYMRVMQEKYGKSKRKCDENEDSCEVFKRRPKIVNEEDICLKDKSTVMEHKAFIRNQEIKGKPDFISIKDKMNRTFSLQRATFNDNSVADILKECPALKKAKIINHEMKRIAAVDVLTSVHKISRNTFMRLLQWKAVPKKINDLIDDGQCTTLAAMPSAFNEKWKTFLLIDEEANTPYPVLIYKSETKLFEVHVEGCIITGAQDFLEGVATLLSSYWVFDRKFPKSSKKTFGYIAGILIGLPGVSFPNSVLTALNKT